MASFSSALRTLGAWLGPDLPINVSVRVSHLQSAPQEMLDIHTSRIIDRRTTTVRVPDQSKDRALWGEVRHGPRKHNDGAEGWDTLVHRDVDV